MAQFIAFLVCYLGAIVAAAFIVLSVLTNGIARTKNPDAVSWHGTQAACLVLIVCVAGVVFMHLTGGR